MKKVTIYSADVDGNLPTNPALLNEYAPPVSGVLNCTAAGTTTFTCSNGCPWTPPSRDNVPPSLDDVGVRVEFEHVPVIGLLPFTGPITLSDRAVMRIEPNTRG